MGKVEIEERAKELRNEYYREWRARNKAKVAEANRRYWEKKAMEMREQKEGRL